MMSYNEQQESAAVAVSGPSATPATSPANGVAQAVPPVRTTRAKKRTSNKSNGHATTSPAADSKTQTIAITLPKETIAWFEQQASQAPFEPSLQKYVAWQLRQWAASEQAAQTQAQAATTTKATQEQEHLGQQ